MLILLAASAFAADPAPVVVQSAPGRFEIAGLDISAAHAIAAQAEEAWRVLATPLALPDSFSSPVFVRLVGTGDMPATAPFHVAVEPGGIVSLRLAPIGTPLPQIRRALVHALLLRVAVTRHGVGERLIAPTWLVQACAGWWQTRAEAAQLDALKLESTHATPPKLAELLRWAGHPPRREFELGAVWLFTFLQSESGRDREWLVFLQNILGGEDPESALTDAFPGRFANIEERELWWRTGWHHLRRARTLPSLETAESRAQLENAARFVFAQNDATDGVIPLREVLARAGEPIVAAEIARRAAELGRWVSALHPFYRNAGLSLGEAFAAASKSAAKREAACAAFERDWHDARELEAASKAALDALERR